jgi:hypothetical protein
MKSADLNLGLSVHIGPTVLDGRPSVIEHQFAMEPSAHNPRLVHRAARARLRVTRRQADRCYGLLRAAGDVWAWLLDTNRQRFRHGLPPIVGYQRCAVSSPLWTALGSYR